MARVLKRPVPIVVVIRTKILGTGFNLMPCCSVYRHAHVVFTAYPWRHFNLELKSKILCCE